MRMLENESLDFEQKCLVLEHTVNIQDTLGFLSVSRYILVVKLYVT